MPVVTRSWRHPLHVSVKVGATIIKVQQQTKVASKHDTRGEGGMMATQHSNAPLN